MPFVTDTHPLIYFHSGATRKLSRKAMRLFRKAEAGEEMIFVPVIVFMEIDALCQKGHISIGRGSFASWVKGLLDLPGFVAQDITIEIILESTGQALVRDPVDKLILATARHLGLPLITRDARIVESGLVEIAW
jgi:PIN domain nuclease of toxin-antitoxin system